MSRTKERNLLNVTTEVRFYMDATRSITERKDVIDAVIVLWDYITELEKLAKVAELSEKPNIINIVRLEINRLMTVFSINHGQVFDTMEAEEKAAS